MQRCGTGSNMDYRAAEQTVQTAAQSQQFENEFNGDIRRRYGNIYETIETAKEKTGRNTIDDFLETFKQLNHREKRAFNLVIPTFISDNANSLMCLEEITGNGNALTIATANSWSCILVKIIIAFSTLAAIKAGTISPPLDDTSEVPLTDEMDLNNPVNAGNPGEILELVPYGLVPVAVFPPFDKPRPKKAAQEFDVFGVIFREPPCTRPGDILRPDGVINAGRRSSRRREEGFCANRNSLQKLLLNIQCYKPRLEELLGTRSYSCPEPYDYGRKKRDNDFDFQYNSVDSDETCGIGNCGTIDDCFDRPCPRYGFSVRFRLRNNYTSLYHDQLTERQGTSCRVVSG